MKRPGFGIVMNGRDKRDRPERQGQGDTQKRVSEETLLRAANGTRTRDLLITNELLYQLS